MNLIGRVIAAETNAREYQSVAVVHAFPISLRRRLAVDVAVVEQRMGHLPIDQTVFETKRDGTAIELFAAPDQHPQLEKLCWHVQ